MEIIKSFDFNIRFNIDVKIKYVVIINYIYKSKKTLAYSFIYNRYLIFLLII